MSDYAIFGPAGNSESFNAAHKTSDELPGYLAQFPLDAFEYQCGRGVKIQAAAAEHLGSICAAGGVTLSVHAPYFISLSGIDQEKRLASARYVLESAAAVKAMGQTRIIVHSGSAGKIGRIEALALAKQTLAYCQSKLDENGFSDVVMCPETMGKINQLGTLGEVIELCRLDERLTPCVDFGHLNARTLGGIKGRDDYAAILDEIENELGHERLRRMHIHFSKIAYTDGGEKHHLTFADDAFGPSPEPLLELLAKRKLAPTVICESDGTQAEDAAYMRRYYYDHV